MPRSYRSRRRLKSCPRVLITLPEIDQRTGRCREVTLDQAVAIALRNGGGDHAIGCVWTGTDRESCSADAWVMHDAEGGEITITLVTPAPEW